MRLPHAWVAPNKSILDALGRCFTVLRFGLNAEASQELVQAFRARGIPVSELVLEEDRLREIYASDLFVLRPDLHIAWRGNTAPDNAAALVELVTGI